MTEEVLSDSQILVSWQPPECNESPVLRYTVECTCTYSHNDDITTSYHYLWSELEDYMECEVCVEPVLQDTYSDPTKRCQTTKTLPHSKFITML